MPQYTSRMARKRRVLPLSTISTGPSCLSVGAHVHYLMSCHLHLRKCSTRGWDLPPHGVAHITYILASEIQDKMDLTFGVKNMFELEGIIHSRTCSVNFLNRSLPISPIAHHKINLEKWPMSK